MSNIFLTLLQNRWEEGKYVCVGLDSDVHRIPKHIQPPKWMSDEYGEVGAKILVFNIAIIDATRDIVCAYKPNIAFYEACGLEGLKALEATCRYIRKVAPGVPVILDAKRADIGNTNNGYVTSAFDVYEANAITVNPYFGKEALEPFLSRNDRGIIVLCRTSNPGAGELQDLHTLTMDPRNKPTDMSAEDWLDALCNDSMQLYERVAYNVAKTWNSNGNCLLVVGATYPVEAAVVRKTVGDIPFLVPGLGKQGGYREATIFATLDRNGTGIIINSSSGTIFASSEEDFVDAARNDVLELNAAIQRDVEKRMWQSA